MWSSRWNTFSAMPDHSGPAACPSPEDVAVVDLQRHQLLGAAKTFEASVQQSQPGAEAGSRTRPRNGSGDEDPPGPRGGRPAEFLFLREWNVLSRVFWPRWRVALPSMTKRPVPRPNCRRTIAGLQGCVDDLRAIWLQVNRLAMNATIEAVHLGPAGEPLSVVAGSMQTLYANAETRSDDTEDSLATLSSRSLVDDTETRATGRPRLHRPTTPR